jgi:hypothetical protein
MYESEAGVSNTVVASPPSALDVCYARAVKGIRSIWTDLVWKKEGSLVRVQEVIRRLNEDIHEHTRLASLNAE